MFAEGNCLHSFFWGEVFERSTPETPFCFYSIRYSQRLFRDLVTREDDGHSVSEVAFMRLMSPITSVCVEFA
jgi:hypothetical protein